MTTALKIIFSPLWLVLLIIAFAIRLVLLIVGTLLNVFGTFLDVVFTITLIRFFFYIGGVIALIYLSVQRYNDEISWAMWGSVCGGIVFWLLFVIYAPIVLNTVGEAIKDFGGSLTEWVLGIYF